MNVAKQNFVSIDEMRQRIATKEVAGSKAERSKSSEKSFESMLFDTVDRVKFSKHAEKRLEMRNISISAEQKARLEDAAEQAMEKGMTESLVMVDDLAFILNVRNKTIVTAVNDTTNAVFTNIDGAIIN